MYINGNLGELVSNTVGPEFGEPIITVPGTSIPVDIKPAQTAMLSTLYGLGVVAVLIYLMRAK